MGSYFFMTQDIANIDNIDGIDSLFGKIKMKESSVILW
jgi:hypothetical protein